MSVSPDVIVVGAGAVGCATAYFLAREGARVLLLDRQAVGAGASFHATGLLVPWRESQDPAVLGLFEAGLRLARELVPRLSEETGVDPLYQTGEALRVALTEAQVARAQAIAARPGLLGARLAFVDGDEARRLEPRLSPRVLGALWATQYAQLDSYRYTLALARGAEQAGAQTLTRQVTGLLRRNGRVAGVQTPSGAIEAERVVLAMGAWSREAEAWLGVPVPVRPQKGQNMRLRWEGEPFRYFLGQVGWGHLIQRADGFLSAGSTEEEGQGFDTTPTAAARQRLLEHALSVMPCLENAQVVHQFAGPRPQSQDDLPLMGPAPGLEGAYLNTGHGHSGIYLAAVSGRHVAELVARGASSVLPVEPYLPARFAAASASGP